MKIYRAANDDYLSQGYSFAASKADARAYRDNPNFGGSTLYRSDIPSDHKVLDLTEEPWETLSSAIGREITPDMGGFMISQALQLQSRILDEIAEAGYDWVRYIDDYPADCITYTICSATAEEIELEEVE